MEMSPPDALESLAAAALVTNRVHPDSIQHYFRAPAEAFGLLRVSGTYA